MSLHNNITVKVTILSIKVQKINIFVIDGRDLG